MDNKLIQRFVKDFNLPIPIYSEPYFSYYLDLYENQFKIKEKMRSLEELIKKIPGAEDNSEVFLDWLDKKKVEIIDSIKNSAAYHNFNGIDITNFKKACVAYSTKEIYKQPFVNQSYISIDLVKANFQALKFVNPEIVLNCETYNDFISHFYDSSYMKESKSLRQFLFGNLNPKRQIVVERYMIELIINYLIGHLYVDSEEIVSVVNDGAILKEKGFHTEKSFKELEKELKDNLGIEVSIEKFELKAIVSPKDEKCYGFVKEISLPEKEIVFKAVTKEYFPQVFKYYFGLQIEDMDLVFYHNNNMAKFLNPIF